jgi:hypothetical protein
MSYGESDFNNSFEHPETISRMNSEHHTYLYDNSSPLILGDKAHKNQKKKLDLAFLYADPLVMEKGN